MSKFSRVVSLAVIAAIGLSACATREEAADVILVESSTSECKLSLTELTAGPLTFKVTNTGTKTTELYILADDKKTVLSEVENIAPNLTRELLVSLGAGKYFAKCIPGMSGKGFTSEFTVSGSISGSGSNERDLNVAARQYVEFVQEQSILLEAGTQEFVAAYLAGQTEDAKKLYAPVRMYWERIEPVAESFGDLDPLLDLREADLEPGAFWTGWHRIEKDLWPPASGYAAMNPEEQTQISNLLLTDTAELVKRISTMTYEPYQMANGAKELLDEVATGKVTGEEEIWSGTDLWDFQANVEGAHKIFQLLEPALVSDNPQLASQLNSDFENLFSLLDEQRLADGFRSYTELTDDEIKKLAASVDTLSESLAQLTAAVV